MREPNYGALDYPGRRARIRSSPRRSISTKPASDNQWQYSDSV